MFLGRRADHVAPHAGAAAARAGAARARCALALGRPARLIGLGLSMGRGKSDRMLVLIGVFKLAKAALLIVVGIGLVDPGWTGAQHLIVRVHAIDARREELLGAGTFAYAGLFLLEGVGLVLRKRWGEWVTVFITGSFVPFEIYELVRAFHWPRLAITIVNLAIVAYLIRRLRDHGTGIG